MISQQTINNIISKLSDDYFVVEATISSNNQINIYADCKSRNISIKDCSNIQKELKTEIGEDCDNYEIKVSSPGLFSPLKVKEQFIKYKNQPIEVIKNDGENIKGNLKNFKSNKLFMEIESNNQILELNIEEIKTVKRKIKTNL